MSESSGTSFQQRLEILIENLQQRFGDRGCEAIHQLGEATLIVPGDRLIEVAAELHDGDEFKFEQLIDLCGVDYSVYGVSEWATGSASFTGFGRGVESGHTHPAEQGPRFAVVYHLLSISNNQRLRLKVSVNEEQPILESVIPIWNVADWFEREAFDLYGILFNGHPDLRRILTDYGFVGHPFRKDFPLEGQVEMRYDMEQQRVIYEPVSIDPRVLVPKVVREDNRYLGEEPQQQDSADV